MTENVKFSPIEWLKPRYRGRVPSPDAPRPRSHKAPKDARETRQATRRRDTPIQGGR